MIPQADRIRSPQGIKTLTIGYDHDLERPDSGYDGWKPISFNRRHSNFEHPDRYRLNEPENIGLRRRLAVGLAFWLSYYEHGLCRWSLRGEGPQCRWDSVDIAGLLLWTGKPAALGAKSHENRAQDARHFLEEYTDWCNGNCYWFSLEDDHKLLDACGGVIGAEQLSEAINEALEETDPVMVQGEAADLAPYLHLKATIVQKGTRS
ncbi:MAG TPA: hypothetical protein VMG10_35570 [Gemmataceae bacterium]|nr:hypothetical protein [Gemmataceae bacterium]